MKTETFILPAYWASALINGDYSGMEEQDINELTAFIESNKEDNSYFSCIDVSEESYFSHRNDARTLACDVSEYTFDVSTIDEELFYHYDIQDAK